MDSAQYEDRSHLLRLTDEQLDAVYWQQVTEFQASELVRINAGQIGLCIKWLNVFNRTSKEEKFARNDLMNLLKSQLANKSCLAYPFLDVANCNRDLNLVYKEYLNTIDMQHQLWMKQNAGEDGNEDDDEDDNEENRDLDIERLFRSNNCLAKLPTIYEVRSNFSLNSLNRRPTKSDLSLRVQEEIKALQALDSTTDLCAQAWREEAAQFERKLPDSLTTAVTPENSRIELKRMESETDSLGVIEIKKPVIAMRESSSQLSFGQSKKSMARTITDQDELILKELQEQDIALSRELAELTNQEQKMHNETIALNASLIQRRYENIKFESMIEDLQLQIITSCDEAITEMEARLQHENKEFSKAKEKFDCLDLNMLPDQPEANGVVGDDSKAMPLQPEMPAGSLPSGIFRRILATLGEDDNSASSSVAVKELNQFHYDIALLDAHFDAALHKRFDSYFEGRKMSLAEELTEKHEQMRNGLTQCFNQAVKINSQMALANRQQARGECFAKLRDIFADIYDADEGHVWDLLSEIEGKYMQGDN